MNNFFDIFKDWGGQIMAAMGILGGLCMGHKTKRNKGIETGVGAKLLRK